MNMLKTSTVLLITTIFAVSAITISVMNEAEAAKPIMSGKPDFIAIIDTPNDPAHHNGEKGKAMFWVKGQGDNMKIAYKIVLNRIDVGQIGDDGNGKDGNSGKGLPHYLWKLHVHPAPGGVHDANYHHLNIVGPADDADLKIAGKTLTGIWDKSDFDNRKDLPNDNHETVAPNTVIEEMCSEDTDVNVHTETHLQVRGIIVPNSDYCDTLS